jgi:predicted DsbA family dithiol-disulfide isomerase
VSVAGAALRIDVFIELICPWCQIGKRQLERALVALRAEQPAVEVELLWHLQPLLPDLPLQGLPFKEFYLHRLGSAAAVAARQAQVRAAGAPVGVDFAFERIARMPHTGLAHALLRDAREQLAPAAFEALLERLFEAHFQRGENIGDAVLLDALAADFGVRRSAVPAAAEAADPRVPGVPFFVFNGREALSGAQPHEALLAAMTRALASA